MVVSLNEREQKLIQVAWQCMDVQPKIDYEKLAQLSGLGTKGSATTAWCVLKKKLISGGGGNDKSVDSPTRSITPKSTTPRKTPGSARKTNGTTTPGSAKRKIGHVENNNDADDDDEEELGMSQVEKRGKKARGANVKTEEGGGIAEDEDRAGAGSKGDSGEKDVKQEFLEDDDDDVDFLQGLEEAAAGGI